MKKRLLSLLLALTLACSLLVFPADAAEVVASGSCGENLTWKLDDDGVLTIEGTGEMSYYPEGRPWVAYKSEIKSVVIEDGVTSIEDEAFRDFSSMTSVTIPDSVTSIGDSAFERCTSLESVNIPEGVTVVATHAFYYCTSLESMIIPEGVTKISYYAFGFCSSLTNVEIPYSVMWISDGSFFVCDSLTDIDYGGTEEQWNDIAIGTSNNDSLFNATMHYHTPTFYAMVVNGIEGEKDYGTDMDAGLMYTSLCKNELAGYLMDEKNIHPFAYNIDSNPISGDILYNWVTHSFSETRGSDLSVFYYSGHGSTDIFPFKKMGEYATGISWTNLLKTLAGNIKGKIVVILDACHSGNLIIEGVDQLSYKDLSRITILTSCTLDETSTPRSVLPFRNLIYGNFTSAIGYGIGFFDGKMNADANGDAVVTVGELYDYADKEVTKHDSDMHVQFYGHDPNLPLFEYQEGGITILSQPKDYVGAANSTAQFSVFAVGGGLTYQWQISDDGGKTWSNSSVKSPAYSVKLTQNRDGRLLRCVISNGNDHIITSNTVSMRIAKLTITKQPVNYLGLVNSAATFSLSAEGEGLTYQWQISDNGGQKWTNSSVKKPEYGTKLTAARDGRMVRCIVSDQYGNTVTSDAVKMTAMYQLEITGQPSDYYGPVNSTAKFTVTAKGTDLTYQWQFSDDGGATWKKSSVTSSVYSAKLTAAKDGRLVRCIVTGGDGHLSTTSNAAAMHIQSGPTITTQPKNYVGKLSSSVTFTVAAQGDGLTYQWQFSDNDGAKWTNSSEKSAVYNTKLTSARDGRLVRCIVKDQYGSTVITDTASMIIG